MFCPFVNNARMKNGCFILILFLMHIWRVWTFLIIVFQERHRHVNLPLIRLPYTFFLFYFWITFKLWRHRARDCVALLNSLEKSILENLCTNCAGSKQTPIQWQDWTSVFDTMCVSFTIHWIEYSQCLIQSPRLNTFPSPAVNRLKLFCIWSK